MVRLFYFSALVLSFLAVSTSFSPSYAEKLADRTAIAYPNSPRRLISQASPASPAEEVMPTLETEEDDDLNNANLGESKLGKPSAPTTTLAPSTNSIATQPAEATPTAPFPPIVLSRPPPLASLSLDDKVRQLLIVGFPESEMTPSLDARLRSLRPGGVILFGRNIKSPASLGKLSSSLQVLAKKTSHVPLLVGLDEEGGAVVRVPTRARLPSAQTLGRLNDPKLTRELGMKTGDLLRSVGINMNFAPVLDISGAGEKSFIGTRSYGGDPEIVANLGMSFAEGNRDEGVIPTFKHFPGLGNSLADSHQKTPTRDLSLSELLATDLKPFQRASKLTFPHAMMVAHLGLPKVDPSGVPASLSKIVMTDLLRDRLKYQGLVITDDLQMGGAGAGETAAQRAVSAFQAGADMLMIVWSKADQESVVTALKKALKEGRISTQRLDASVARILEAKRWLQQRKPASSQTWVQAETALSKFNLNVYRQIVHGQLGPFQARRVIAFSSSALALQAFRKELKIPSSIFHITAKTRASSIATIMNKYPEAAFVFGVSHPENTKLLDELSPDLHARLIVFNQDSEANVDDSGDYKSVIEIGSLGSAPWSVLSDELNLANSIPLASAPPSAREANRSAASIPADITSEPPKVKRKIISSPPESVAPKSEAEDP